MAKFVSFAGLAEAASCAWSGPAAFCFVLLRGSRAWNFGTKAVYSLHCVPPGEVCVRQDGLHTDVLFKSSVFLSHTN